MTDLTKKIAEARRLDAEAMPGPWRNAEGTTNVVGCGRLVAVASNCVMATTNASFIAHARNHHAALWDVVAEADYLLQTGSGEAKARLRAALARLEAGKVQP